MIEALSLILNVKYTPCKYRLFDLKLKNCNHGNVDLEGVQATKIANPLHTYKNNRQKGVLECLSFSLMTFWSTIRKDRSSFIEIVRKNETCTSFF